VAGLRAASRSAARCAGRCRLVCVDVQQSLVARVILARVDVKLIRRRLKSRSIFQKPVQSLVEPVERQRNADVVSARVHEKNLAGTGSRAKFFHYVVLYIEFGKATARSAACKWRHNLLIGVAGPDANICAEGYVDGDLHNQLKRLTFHRAPKRDQRIRNGFALDLPLRDLLHFADFLVRLLIFRLALHDPIPIGRGGTLRCFALRRLRLRHVPVGYRLGHERARLSNGSGCTRAKHGNGEPPYGVRVQRHPLFPNISIQTLQPLQCYSREERHSRTGFSAQISTPHPLFLYFAWPHRKPFAPAMPL
jgi:hypothetical protein